MSPRGTKRVAMQAPAGQPEAKQLADTLRKNGVTKATFKSLLEIVDHELSRAAFPEDCRKMLEAALPHSICIPSDVRHEHQNATVQMLGELAESVQQKLQEAVEEENAHLADFEAKKAHFEAQVQAVEATLTHATEATAGRKAELAEVSSVFLRKKEALAERHAEQKKGDAEIVVARADRETLVKVQLDSFQTLKAGQWEAGKEKQLYKDVKSITSKLQIDGSMQTALPSSLTKHPDARGQFDQFVVGQFEEALLSKIAQLTAAEAADAAPAAARAAAVTAAEGEREAACNAQQDCAAALAGAREEQNNATAAQAAARAELAAYGPEYAKAVQARDAKQAEFECFRDHNVADFVRLRDRFSKAHEQQLAAGEGDATNADVAEAGA